MASSKLRPTTEAALGPKSPGDGVMIGFLPRGTICRAGDSDDVAPPTAVSTSIGSVAAVSVAWATSAEATTVAFTPMARGRVEDSTTVARTPIEVLGALAAGGEPILLVSPALQIGKGLIRTI